MIHIARLLPPETDLCKLPSGVPPNGQVPAFGNTGLKSVTIPTSIIMTTIAVTFGLGRLYVNVRKFTWSDLFVLLTILFNIADTVVMIVFVKYFRHTWDLPLCWMNGQFEQVSYVWENLLNFSLFFAKTATLLLLRQLFTVSRSMNIAIWIAIAMTFLIYSSGLVITSYFAAPHIGKTWDQLIAEVMGTTIFPLYWAVAQGAASTLLDVYIFILPLPTISRLKLSRPKKIQVMAVFFVAFSGVVASSVSLVYRVKSIEGHNSDNTYNAGVLLLCNLAEMNSALIICSAPGFASFMRSHVLESWVFKTFRLALWRSHSARSGSNTASFANNPNRPRSGREQFPDQKYRGYLGVSDTWLLKSGTTVDVVSLSQAPMTGSEDLNGLSVFKTVDVERATWKRPSHESQRG